MPVEKRSSFADAAATIKSCVVHEKLAVVQKMNSLALVRGFIVQCTAQYSIPKPVYA